MAAWPEVDFVIKFDEDTPEELIQNLNPSVLVKGSDTTGEIPGADFVVNSGGDLHIVDIREDLSTSAIIERAANLQ